MFFDYWVVVALSICGMTSCGVETVLKIAEVVWRRLFFWPLGDVGFLFRFGLICRLEEWAISRAVVVGYLRVP